MSTYLCLSVIQAISIFSTNNRQNNYKRKMQIPAFYKVYVRQCKVMFNYSIDTYK